jgi:hypothetical protein
MTQYYYYAGPPHHKEPMRFAKELLGGEYIVSGSQLYDKGNDYSNIAEFDDNDTIWFFADLYEHILPYLKGKSVFIPHGMGFKPFLKGNETRQELLRRHMDQIWSPSPIDEREYKQYAIDPSKVKRIGYTVLHSIDIKPFIQNSIFIAIGWYEELASWNNMLQYIKSIPESIKLFISMHPDIPEHIKIQYFNWFREHQNFEFLGTPEELRRGFSFASRCIVGLSSVAAPFHFLRRPVIFVKDMNRFPFFQWYRIRHRISDELFGKLLSESLKVLVPSAFNEQEIMNARLAPSAYKMFYPTNWDRGETENLIRSAIRQI